MKRIAVQPRSMHRAEMLMRQQQAQKESGWEFMTDAEANQCLTHSVYDVYDVVPDREQGGYWLRRKGHAPAARLAKKPNRYERPVTRFGDLMDGLSHITKGLQKLDQASDGDLGETLFDMFR